MTPSILNRPLALQPWWLACYRTANAISGAGALTYKPLSPIVDELDRVHAALFPTVSKRLTETSDLIICGSRTASGFSFTQTVLTQDALNIMYNYLRTPNQFGDVVANPGFAYDYIYFNQATSLWASTSVSVNLGIAKNVALGATVPFAVPINDYEGSYLRQMTFVAL